jgi:UTP-glucose-1-phosphate uridylyltransferase
MKPTLLILAAGMGSRYGGLKQIEPVGPNGETILEYSIFDAIRAGFGKIIFVIRHSFADEFISLVESKLKADIEVGYVYQELDYLPAGYPLPADRVKPWGTGHAILMAKDVIHEPFAAINADDFYGGPAFQEIASFFRNEVSPTTYGMVGYLLKNTLSEFGTVSRGVCKTDRNANLIEINERTKIAREGNSIVYREGATAMELDGNAPVSMNFWGFHPSLFTHLESRFKSFLDEKINVPKAEFFIPSVIFDLIQSGIVQSKVLHADSPWFGVTYPDDKPFVVTRIQQLVKRGHYPGKLWG